MSEWGVTVSCRGDGSAAFIEIIYPLVYDSYTMTVEDVLQELKMQNVVNGIDELKIEETVEEVCRQKKPLRNICVASCRIRKSIHIVGMDNEPQTHEFNTFIQNARSISAAVSNLDKVSKLPRANLLPAGVPIISITYPDMSDIFGRTIKDSPLPYNFKPSDTVDAVQRQDSLEYVSRIEGYFAIDEKMRLHIIPMFMVSADQMQMHLLLLPLPPQQRDYGYELISVKAQQQKELNLGVHSSDGCINIAGDAFANDNLLVLPFSSGRPPVAATGGGVEYRIKLDQRPMATDEDKVDYSAYSPYIMVKEGDVIANLPQPIPGTAGMTVTGKVLKPENKTEAAIIPGDNVTAVQQQNYQQIIASKDGVVQIKDNRISLLEYLQINGDIGPETGNIRFTKNVLVKGNVLSGYTLESGGNLIIEGSIEGGANVLCRGDLNVTKGIFGKNGSRVFVRGSLETGYIQEADIQVYGDLTVIRYILDSVVRCRGKLTVTGQGVRGDTHSAVMGGETYALCGMDIHSAGTGMNHTTLGAGIDPQMYDQLKKLRLLVSSLESKAVRIQKGLAIDLKTPDAAEKLKKLRPYQRKSLLSGLGEIKDILMRLTPTREKMKLLQEQAFAPDESMNQICIHRHALPPLFIHIGESRHSETSSLGAIRYHKENSLVKLSKL